MQQRLRVGAAQIAPKFFDKQGALEKTRRTTQEAGRLGLDLLVFPETYFAAYPYWPGTSRRTRSRPSCARRCGTTWRPAGAVS